MELNQSISFKGYRQAVYVLLITKKAQGLQAITVGQRQISVLQLAYLGSLLCSE